MKIFTAEKNVHQKTIYMRTGLNYKRYYYL